jgi:hypothetical protein
MAFDFNGVWHEHLTLFINMRYAYWHVLLVTCQVIKSTSYNRSVRKMATFQWWHEGPIFLRPPLSVLSILSTCSLWSSSGRRPSQVTTRALPRFILISLQITAAVCLNREAVKLFDHFYLPDMYTEMSQNPLLSSRYNVYRNTDPVIHVAS